MSDEEPAQQNLTSRQACELIERLTGQKPTSDQLRQWCRQGYVAPQELSPITLPHVRNRQGHYELAEEDVRQFIKHRARREADLVAFVKWCKRRSAVHRAKKTGLAASDSIDESSQDVDVITNQPESIPPVIDSDQPVIDSDPKDGKSEPPTTSTGQADSDPAPELHEELKTATVEIESVSEQLSPEANPLHETPVVIPPPLPVTSTITIKPAADTDGEAAASTPPELPVVPSNAMQTRTVSVPVVEEPEEKLEPVEEIESPPLETSDELETLSSADQADDLIAIEEPVEELHEVAQAGDASIENASSFADGLFDPASLESVQNEPSLDLAELVAAEQAADAVLTSEPDSADLLDFEASLIPPEVTEASDIEEQQDASHQPAARVADEAHDEIVEPDAVEVSNVEAPAEDPGLILELTPELPEPVNSELPQLSEWVATPNLNPAESETAEAETPESQASDSSETESKKDADEDDFTAGIFTIDPQISEASVESSQVLDTSPPVDAPVAKENGVQKPNSKPQVPIARPVVVKPFARKVEHTSPDQPPAKQNGPAKPAADQRTARPQELESLANAYAQFRSGDLDTGSKPSEVTSPPSAPKNSPKASPLPPAPVDDDEDSPGDSDTIQPESFDMGEEESPSPAENEVVVALDSSVDLDVDDVRSNEPESDSVPDSIAQPGRTRTRPVVQASRFLWAWVGAIAVGGVGFGLSFLINDPFGAVALSSVAVAATGMSGLWWIGK